AQRREFETNGRTDRLDSLFIQARSLFYRPWADSVRSIFGRGIGFYSRGFPRGPNWSIAADKLVAHLAGAASWIAPEARISVRADSGHLGQLATIPELRWVRILEILPASYDRSGLTDQEVVDLLHSPYLTGLRVLGLARHDLSNVAAIAVRDARCLTAL